jgi:hypothetical protein
MLRNFIAIIILLSFTVWLQWAAGPLFALPVFILTIWYIVRMRNGDPKVNSNQKHLGFAIISAAVIVLCFVGAYFWWISGYTF